MKPLRSFDASIRPLCSPTCGCPAWTAWSCCAASRPKARRPRSSWSPGTAIWTWPCRASSSTPATSSPSPPDRKSSKSPSSAPRTRSSCASACANTPRNLKSGCASRPKSSWSWNARARPRRPWKVWRTSWAAWPGKSPASSQCSTPCPASCPSRTATSASSA